MKILKYLLAISLGLLGNIAPISAMGVSTFVSLYGMAPIRVASDLDFIHELILKIVLFLFFIAAFITGIIVLIKLRSKKPVSKNTKIKK